MSIRTPALLLCLAALAAAPVGAAVTADGGYVTRAIDAIDFSGAVPVGANGWSNALYENQGAAYDASKAYLEAYDDSDAMGGQAVEAVRLDPTQIPSQSTVASNHIEWYWRNTGNAWGDTATAQVRFKVTDTEAFVTPGAPGAAYIGAPQNIFGVTSAAGKEVRLFVAIGNQASYVGVSNVSASGWYGAVPLTDPYTGAPCVAGVGGINYNDYGQPNDQVLNSGWVYQARKGYDDFGGRRGTSLIPVDVTEYHTYTLVMKNGGVYFDLLIDGLSVFGNNPDGTPIDSIIGTSGSSTDSALKPGGAKLEGLMFGIHSLGNYATGDANVSGGTGSVALDWVAAKGGADYNWDPWANVPEPGSMLALSTGLLGLLGLIRRRRA